MTGFAALLAEDRRKWILSTLNEADDYRQNDLSLKLVLERFGHRVGRDIIRADLVWLEQHGLVTVERLGGEALGATAWIAALSEPGQDVAQGRSHPGIARRPPA
jgi:hypothetical protein